MEIYLVGGAVRDLLLDYPIKDKDWLVTGATLEQMNHLGYQQVGQSFPVFLHPTTKEEYALARTEKKSGSGYTGFVCDFSPSITVEQDLKRRDLTINAMAMTESEQIIDPYGGEQDLKHKLLRHVSECFSEDPLRVLRVARFAARYHHLGFQVADSTMTLMKEMTASGELNDLVPERVWQETQSALSEADADVYFSVLKECGALEVIFPELAALWGVPNPEKWHPEIDTGVHTIMVLQQACLLTKDPILRFAALTHDLGKATTPKDIWPHHHGHEKRGVEIINALCKRLTIPNSYKELATIMSEFHTHSHKAFELKANTIIKLFNQIDAWRKPQRFEHFLLCCIADLRGRTGFEHKDYPQSGYLKRLLTLALEVQVKDVVAEGYQGEAIRQQLTQRRIAKIKPQVAEAG